MDGEPVLAWEAADRPRVAALLAAVGFVATTDDAWVIDGLVIRLRDGPSAGRLTIVPDGRTPGVMATDADEAVGGPSGPLLLAIGIATVDADAVAGPGRGRDLAADAILGARVVATDDPRVVLLEPMAEGRLAATLARHGEGPAAIYVAPPAAARELRERLAALDTGTREGAGPFGRQVLARGRPAAGPHLLLVAAAPSR